MYKVEKNIKIPSVDIEYPFSEMSIGNSFFVKCKASEIKETRAKLASKLKSYKRQGAANNFKLSILQVDKGLRVWRVAAS